MSIIFSLKQDAFTRIASGKKYIEIRLNRGKSKDLVMHDIIFFKQVENEEVLKARVTDLLPYPSFTRLLADFPITCFGFPQDTKKTSYLQHIYTLYTKEEEQKHSVLAIKFELLNST